jgi:hypothetical protein
MSRLPQEDAAIHYDPDHSVSNAMRIKESHEAQLLRIEGVTGVGVGKNGEGDDAIVVYLRDASSARHIPSQIDGVPVLTEVTGEIDAY